VLASLGDQPVGHFVQRHVLRIADLATGGGVKRCCLIDQRAGKKHGPGLLQQLARLDGHQVGIAGAGADKPDFSGH
jgi:hypothetical protein